MCLYTYRTINMYSSSNADFKILTENVHIFLGKDKCTLQILPFKIQLSSVLIFTLGQLFFCDDFSQLQSSAQNRMQSLQNKAKQYTDVTVSTYFQVHFGSKFLHCGFTITYGGKKWRFLTKYKIKRRLLSYISKYLHRFKKRSDRCKIAKKSVRL